jgi:hypothetical protein
MHKVAFLVERTDERIDCLLNPESLLRRRTAGLRPRTDATGVVTGHGMSDDPLVATGGGVTEYDLDLLFDSTVLANLQPAPSPATDTPHPEPAAAVEIDIRDRTQPLWALTENAAGPTGYGAPPRVRLIWGQAWNIRGVIVAVSERLERFTATGIPQRSWLRLRLRRVAEDPPGDPSAPDGPDNAAPGLPPMLEVPIAPDGLPLMRLDQIAADRLGDPALWPSIAEASGIADPLLVPSGTLLVMPAGAQA